MCKSQAVILGENVVNKNKTKKIIHTKFRRVVSSWVKQK